MKRLFSLCIIICLLASGCTVRPDQSTDVSAPELPDITEGDRPDTEDPVQTEDAASDAIDTTEPEAPTEPAVPLLDQGISVGESGNLLYIPNEYVEGMPYPELYLYGHGILLKEYVFNGSEGTIHLKHISLDDGSLLAEASFALGGATTVTIGSEGLGLSDCGSGMVIILNEDLTERASYSFPCVGESWYLSPELDKLYSFSFTRGVCSIDLTSREEKWIVDHANFVSTLGNSNAYVIFDYTDFTNLRSYTYCLNLYTGLLETLPVKGSDRTGHRYGETWLFREMGMEGAYTLVCGDTAGTFIWPDSSIELTQGGRHLLLADSSYRNLSLYETDGTFLSACSLPVQDYASVGSDFIWSGYWQGYFFIDYFDDCTRLMFWDISSPAEGEDLLITPIEQPAPVEPILDQEFYDRAAELSERFDLNICIGEQCLLDYKHYTSYAMTDPVFLEYALNTLENCLSRYPEGFFSQLQFSDYEQVRIDIVSGLLMQSDIDQPPSVEAVVSNMDDYYIIIIDGYLLNENTLYHELSHVIDKRLAWDASLNSEALFSEEMWLSHQPDGFEYAESYTELPAGTAAFSGSEYFINDYGMTFPTEDRATLMAAAMYFTAEEFGDYQGRNEKLQYYADCIRDSFDTTGWPDVTAWEEVLQ